LPLAIPGGTSVDLDPIFRGSVLLRPIPVAGGFDDDGISNLRFRAASEIIHLQSNGELRYYKDQYHFYCFACTRDCKKKKERIYRLTKRQS
jgi:hypothetical protein